MSTFQLALLILCALVLQQVLPLAVVTGGEAVTTRAASAVPPGFDMPHETVGSR